MRRLLLSLFILVASASMAFAQTPVFTKPSGVTTGNYSGSIVTTDTFQSVLVASTSITGRTACTIQNLSSANKMYVYFGDIANATTSNSIALNPGQAVYCNVGNVVLKDQVSITGTSGDTFYASQQ